MIITTQKKKGTVVWQVHNYIRKKNFQSSGRQWECLGGFHKIGCFGGFIMTTWKKKVQSSVAVGRNDYYDPKKKGTVVWRVHKYVRKKNVFVIWPSVGMFGGVPRARMFWPVHNYDLKKKTYSHLTFGRNDNYALKKKIQSFGGCIITFGKNKWLSRLAVTGNGWGGFHELGCFGGS
jgi:hypothetical protein